MYRSLLVHLDDGEHGAAHAEVARQLARRFGAHLVGLAPVGRMPVSMSFAATAALADAMDAVRARAQRRADDFVADCHAAGLTSVEALADDEDAVVSLVEHAHCSDLLIIGQGELPDASIAVEQVVLMSARPTLVLPWAGRVQTLGERVLVAWNGSPEAARAVADAMPLLCQAREVTVMRCEPPGTDLDDLGGLMRERMEALRRWLMWHGVDAQVRLEASTVDAGNELLSRAADLGADLLVMGAWGRPRWTERVLGGATRTLLRSMTLPVLMSH
ncbi:universal stress protein [Pelomonas sp. P7]|uniref:Universal stress protein n=1 Tax=Pelomonas caseinilytica TaxID=2906763 RepID=A0ABS8XAB3_9BURK|nr:universal stress protein [Pelomonas sp. P7]MCE4537842.1 universal stress protein [Pelomonas sp. P7]